MSSVNDSSLDRRAALKLLATGFAAAATSACSQPTEEIVPYVDMPEGFPPGPCRVTISFYDGDGRAIGQSTQSLDPGMTAQFDYSTASLPAGSRQRIRASVHVEAADGSIIPCVMPSLELFAADTGKSALFVPGGMIGSE